MMSKDTLSFVKDPGLSLGAVRGESLDDGKGNPKRRGKQESGRPGSSRGGPKQRVFDPDDRGGAPAIVRRD